MNPVTHLLIGWTVAEVAGLQRRRDRALVAVAGIVPDLDGFGIVAEKATLAAGWEEPLLWWTDYHHVLCHNLGFALLVTAVAAGLSRRADVAALTLLSFHLHLIGDLVGARGPDGYLWPIRYLLPFSDAWEWSWQGAWALNAPPNIALTIGLLAVAFRGAWARGHSPVELVSRRADAVFVATLRARFGEPPAG